MIRKHPVTVSALESIATTEMISFSSHLQMVSSLASQSHWGAKICCGSRLMLLGMQLEFCYHSRDRAVNNSGAQSWNRNYWTGDNLWLLFVPSNNGTREHPQLLLFDVSTEREKTIKCALFFSYLLSKSCEVGYWFKAFRKKRECYWSLLQNRSSQLPAAPIEKGQFSWAQKLLRTK